MSQDNVYKSIPFIYQSRGLVAREITDRTPEHTYINFMNCLEREENAVSSRFGLVIVNRDPNGTPSGVNYLFANPIISLARMIYLGLTYRYGGDSAGNLFRRQGDLQGPYTEIYSGLSGSPFTSVSTNCFATGQTYLFIFDRAVSLKDSGTGTPSLVGIDPPSYTANSQAYSPLLTLVDNFASTNSYTSSGFSSPWTYAPITTLSPFSGQQITDFQEFIGATYSVSGGSATASASSSDQNVTATFTCAAFPSTPTSGQPVTLSATALGQFLFLSSGAASIVLQYSIDSGVTWTEFYATTANSNQTTGPTPATVDIYGLANLSTLQVQIVAIASTAGAGVSVIGTISAVSVSITPTGEFGLVANGMISVLNSAIPTIQLPIASIVSTSKVSSGLYTELLVMTETPHGLTGTVAISIYGCSNNLCDGFYIATITGASTFTVLFDSAVLLSATGGFVMGGQTQPSSCVLQNLYSTPYPSQFSAWGFYQTVNPNQLSFPIGSWIGTVAQNSTATIGNTIALDLSINNEVTDDDLIVLTLSVGDPASISNIRLQFDVNGSGYGASYYYKDVSPAYYQQGVQQLEDAYTTTEQQIFADTLGLITGQTPNSTTAQLQPANFSTGQGSWLACLLRRGDFVAVGSAGESGLDWGNVTGWQLVITTNTVGSSTVATNGLYLQWGYGPSSFGGVGYDYRYTYLNANTLTESNGSSIQEFDSQFGYLSSLVAPFYLRQAAQVSGLYSTDPQVTHLRIYRRGGIANQNWFQIDQVPNILAGGAFFYKDVVSDDALAQAQILVLDNDPPVTSSLPVPISTTLSLATTGGGNTYYATYQPQLFYVTQSSAAFVPNQIVQVGYPQNLEGLTVISGGVGFFSAICRLKHNAGEPVNVYSIPRQPCYLSELAYGQTWLAGDTNNPNYLYFSKKSLPESFGPQNYIPVGSSSGDAITAIVNWRGTLFVKTLTTWWLIIGGANPYAQPTGCAHGGPATMGWCVTEQGVYYRAPDGLRNFQGSQGLYISLPVEFIYRQNPDTPLPLVDPTQAAADVMAYYNNDVYISYVSLSSGLRYRLIWSTTYQRFRIDSVPATAMLWERDTNTFVVAKPVGQGFAICQDYVTTQDYDDGGWVGGVLTQDAIQLNLQPALQDLKQPHNPKQWNVLEDDVDTGGQELTTFLQFDYDQANGVEVIPDPNPVENTSRAKIQRKVNGGEGQSGYRMSWIHQISVTVAPIFYQENIYATELAPSRTSYDTYILKFGTDECKIVKQGYFDYTSTTGITVKLYADANAASALYPYYTFTLPAESGRLSVRELFAAKKMRLWRLIATTPDGSPFQFWVAPRIEQKTIREGVNFSITELTGV
jgi:hypothetical protein